MKFYNTLTRTIDEFHPNQGNEVKMYNRSYFNSFPWCYKKLGKWLY